MNKLPIHVVGVFAGGIAECVGCDTKPVHSEPTDVPVGHGVTYTRDIGGDASNVGNEVSEVADASDAADVPDDVRDTAPSDSCPCPPDASADRDGDGLLHCRQANL
jgi:hypothetical protein